MATQTSRLLIIEKYAEQYRDAFLDAFSDLDILAVPHRDGLGDELEGVEALFGFGPSFDDELNSAYAQFEVGSVSFFGYGHACQIAIFGAACRCDFITRGARSACLRDGSASHDVLGAGLRPSAEEPRRQDLGRVRPGAALVEEGRYRGHRHNCVDLAQRCKAFGMTVVGLSKKPRSIEGFDSVLPRPALVDAVSDADFVVLLVPLSPETSGMIDAKILRAMKSSAFLINVGRGALCDEDALIMALRENWIAGAGMDAFVAEPLPKDHPSGR